MKKFSPIILLFIGGIVFGLAAFPVFAQKEESREIVINIRPLKDFGYILKDQIAKREVNIDESFKVVLEGVLTADGKLDRRQSKYTVAEGKPQLVQIARVGIEAINDSGWLGYLRNAGAEKVKITLMQDGETFSAVIQSELKDENKARTMTSGMNAIISVFKSRQNLSDDEKSLLDALKTTSEGNSFVLNFALPKQLLHEIVLRNWAKANDNN